MLGLGGVSESFADDFFRIDFLSCGFGLGIAGYEDEFQR